MVKVSAVTLTARRLTRGHLVFWLIRWLFGYSRKEMRILFSEFLSRYIFATSFSTRGKRTKDVYATQPQGEEKPSQQSTHETTPLQIQKTSKPLPNPIQTRHLHTNRKFDKVITQLFGKYLRPKQTNQTLLAMTQNEYRKLMKKAEKLTNILLKLTTTKLRG